MGIDETSFRTACRDKWSSNRQLLQSNFLQDPGCPVSLPESELWSPQRCAAKIAKDTIDECHQRAQGKVHVLSGPHLKRCSPFVIDRQC